MASLIAAEKQASPGNGSGSVITIAIAARAITARIDALPVSAVSTNFSRCCNQALFAKSAKIPLGAWGGKLKSLAPSHSLGL